MLYNRIINSGTLDEPKGKPNPQFALPASVNWIRALRILADDPSLCFQKASDFYAEVKKGTFTEQEENTIFEQLLLSLHHLSALNRFRGQKPVSDYGRIGVLAWYYGISNAASAMITAQSKQFKETHAETARLWNAQIVNNQLALPPFDFSVSTLVKKEREKQISDLKQGHAWELINKPETPQQARSAAITYLSGTASWYAGRTEEDLKKNRDFKALQVENFKTKAAQALRDKRLEKKSVGFLHQAFRYRGKANYREALYMAYGSGTETTLADFIEDLFFVQKAFLAMAGAFAKRKLGDPLWHDFCEDVDAHSAFSLQTESVWRS